MKNTITVNKTAIVNFAQEGGKFIFKKEAEKELIKLLQLQKLIEEAIEEVKAKIESAGLSISPDFKGVVGDKVKVIYRTFGEKYSYQKDAIELAKPYLKEFKVYKVDSKAVDEYFEKEGRLPEGIVEKERAKKISLVVEDKEELKVLPSGYGDK